MIKVENLSVRFGEKLVLNNIDLTIPKGKSTVIIGRSGCGKTVLIKSIIGLVEYQQGKIEVSTLTHTVLDKKSMVDVRKKISMVFQNSALFDSMNVFQNVAFPLVEHTDYKPTLIKKIVEEKLSMVGLKGIEELMPSELSGGMRKRVGLARAIVLEPEYVFYDEPTTGLDPETTEEIINLMRELDVKGNWTSVIITHDKKVLEAFPENIVLLKEGTITYQGHFNSLTNHKF